MENIRLNYKIWIETDDRKGIMGDGKWHILKAIEKYGSLMAATEALGITYRKTWGDLKEIEKSFGFPLLEKVRGGKEGGSSYLTPQGRELVKAFDEFHDNSDKIIEKEFEIFLSKLKAIENIQEQ